MLVAKLLSKIRLLPTFNLSLLIHLKYEFKKDNHSFSVEQLIESRQFIVTEWFLWIDALRSKAYPLYHQSWQGIYQEFPQIILYQPYFMIMSERWLTIIIFIRLIYQSCAINMTAELISNSLSLSTLVLIKLIYQLVLHPDWWIILFRKSNSCYTICVTHEYTIAHNSTPFSFLKISKIY